jgi:hypothetical protein
MCCETLQDYRFREVCPHRVQVIKVVQCLLQFATARQVRRYRVLALLGPRTASGLCPQCKAKAEMTLVEPIGSQPMVS